MRRKTNIYLKPEDLAAALEESQRLGAPTVEVCTMFRLIIDNVLRHRNFSGYDPDFKADMASHALEKCIKNIKNYKRSRAASCFSYYTRAVMCGFMEVLRKHYRYKNLMRDLKARRAA